MFFADRVISAIEDTGTRLCLGIDPDFEHMPEFFKRDPSGLYDFCGNALNVADGRVPAVKFQSAFFEIHGRDGIQVLEDLIRNARMRGFLVILDAKRGDIGDSAMAYAVAYLAEGSRMEVDALTVNPWCGLDTLEPFIQVAAESMNGLFVVTRTTNKGSGHFQDHGRIPRTYWLPKMLNGMADRLRGVDTEFSGLGAVVGIHDSHYMRQHMPKNLFLMPGYGEQGGRATHAAPGAGFVSASRSLLFPREVENKDDWMDALNVAMTEAIQALDKAEKHPLY